MTHNEHERVYRRVTGAVYWLAGTAALVMALAVIAFPRPVDALPAYAQQTGLSCGRCHVSPGGGGALSAFGKKYAANGHKVAGKGSEAPAPASAGVSGMESSTPWAAPRVCYGWCPSRDK